MNLITAPAQVGYTPVSTAIVHSTTVSLTSRAPVQPVHLVQYDQTMPVIAVALTANGQPYTVPSGAAVNVRMDKPDGTHVYNPALGVSTDGQTAYIGITAQMTAAAGSSSPIVEIVVNKGVAGTAAFPVIIDPNPVPDSAYESTDEYLTLYEILQQAQSAAQIVQQNAQNLQNVTDNLEAIQNAAANAQAAAQSAQEAQTAAQQALGFRTFFSAVSPDKNGDLDPSRPMTTPTAQASWTIKSKGDRIQSVRVNGFTTQSGTGGPGPTNIRAISTAGFKLETAVLDGSADENWIASPAANGAYRWGINAGGMLNILPSPTSVAATIFSTRYKSAPADTTYQRVLGISVDTTGNLRIYDPDCNSDLSAWKNKLSKNPLTIWYTPADESQATGLYIPQIAQGHEYRCQMLKLTAPLCEGDTVHTRVVSGCDAKLVFDGSADENWSQGVLNGFLRYIIPVENIPVTDSQNGKGFSNFLYLADSGGTGVTANKYCFTVASNGKLYVKTDGTQTLAQFKEFLSKENLVVYLRSTAYTEANDIPVALETHQQAVLVLTGTEKDLLFAVTGLQTEPVLSFYINNINRRVAPKCSHYAPKNTGIPIPDNSLYFSDTYFEKKLAIRDSSWSSLEDAKSYLASQYAAGTPVTVVYKLSAPAIYAHDPVDLVPVPYTEEDATAAQQLANTPSTLPYIDSADVPMLLDSIGMPEPDVTVQSDGTLDAENTQKAAEWVRETAQRLMAAPLASAPPVAGTYVVSSQDGTTVLVSLKAMQDGGDAATLEGMTLDDIKALISSMIADANK